MKESIDKTIMQSDNPISIIKQPNIDSLILEQQQMDAALDSLYDFSNSEDDGFEEEFSDQLQEKIRAKLKDANMQFEADETPIESDRVRHVTFRDRLVDVVSCSPLDSPDFSEDEDINEKSLEEIQTASQRPSSDSFKGEDNIYDFENEFVSLYCESSKLEDISEDNELILESNVEKTVIDDGLAASCDEQADANEKAETDDGQIMTDYEQDVSNDVQVEADDKPVIAKFEDDDKESDFNGSDNEYESNDFELDDVDEDKGSEVDEDKESELNENKENELNEDNENENKHDDEIEQIDNDDENDSSGKEENLCNVQDDESKTQLNYNTEITKETELENINYKTEDIQLSNECKSEDDEDKQKNTDTQLESAELSKECENDDDEDEQKNTIENIIENIVELKESNEIEAENIVDEIKLDDDNEIRMHSKIFGENIVNYDNLDIPKKDDDEDIDDADENLIKSTEENTHEINKRACSSNFNVLEQQVVIDDETFQSKIFESNPSVPIKCSINKNDSHNKSLKKTEDVLNLKRYEPSMNSASLFKNFKETNSALPMTPKKKSSSITKKTTMQKATKKLPNYQGNPRSQYGLSKEELEELKNKTRQKSLQKKMEEMKIEQDKLQRKRESQQAFEAWLSKKKIEDKTKNSNKNKVTDDQPEPKKSSKESDEAFQNWLEKKEEQLYINKIISQFQKEEASLDHRKRSDANKAFKKWLRRKHREQHKTRTSSRPLDYSNSIPLSSRHLEMFAQKFYAYLGNNM